MKSRNQQTQQQSSTQIHASHSQGGRGCGYRGRGPGPRGGRAQPPQAPDGRSGVHQGDSQVSRRQDS